MLDELPSSIAVAFLEAVDQPIQISIRAARHSPSHSLERRQDRLDSSSCQRAVDLVRD